MSALLWFQRASFVSLTLQDFWRNPSQPARLSSLPLAVATFAEISPIDSDFAGIAAYFS
jgi:hypothetical protein